MDPDDNTKNPLGNVPLGTKNVGVSDTVPAQVENTVPQAPEKPEAVVNEPVDQSNIGVSEEPIASEPKATETPSPTIDPFSNVSEPPAVQPEEPTIMGGQKTGVSKPPSMGTIEEPPAVEPSAPEPESPVGAFGGTTKLKP